MPTHLSQVISFMLVLTRKSEQKIKIGNDIVITVLKVQGEQVSLGIEAPKNVKVIREELLKADAAKSNRASLIDKSKTPLLKSLAKRFQNDD